MYSKPVKTVNRATLAKKVMQAWKETHDFGLVRERCDFWSLSYNEKCLIEQYLEGKE